MVYAIRASSPYPLLTTRTNYHPFGSSRPGPIHSIVRAHVNVFIVFWYDNLLIVSNSSFTRDLLQEAVRSVANKMNAKWKVPKTVAPCGFANSQEAFTQTTNFVEYLGLQMKMGNGKASWAHAPESIS